MPATRTGATRVASLRSLTELELLQAVVTVLIAAVVAAAGLLISQASGGRQQAVREEIKRAAATIEDVRLVYGTEAPLALRVALARIRADELHRAAAAAGPAGTAAEVDAVVQEQIAFAFATGEEGTGGLADGKKYRTPDGGFDVGRRLADVRAAQPELAGLDPDATQAAADRRGRVARTLTGGIAVLMLAYLVLAVAWSALRRRRHGGGDPGLIPQPWSSEESRREATTVALLAWLLLTLLPGPQLAAADDEQRSQALAARGAR